MNKDRIISSASAAMTLTNRFMELTIAGQLVGTPYWMNKNPLLVDTPYYQAVSKGGKLSPEEIVQSVFTRSTSTNVDLASHSRDEIRKFMLENAIGVDCSGFTYQVVREIYSALGGNGFDEKVIGAEPHFRGITKTAARDLTDTKNSVMINEIRQAMPGDMIRCQEGRHIIVIISNNGDTVTCAHSRFSSNRHNTNGVVTFTVDVVDPMLDIAKQRWNEYLNDGSNYLEWLKDNYDTPTLWRLKILDEIYKEI